MRIGIVGGPERIEARLRALASAEGHALEFHPGHMNGTGSGKLKAIVDRCDLLVVITDVNSHAAVLQARELARRTGRPLRLLRKLGTAQLRLLLN
jgi:D-serine deaminase-like pyridoxal phosphate-dependent protein